MEIAAAEEVPRRLTGVHVEVPMGCHMVAVADGWWLAPRSRQLLLRTVVVPRSMMVLLLIRRIAAEDVCSYWLLLFDNDTLLELFLLVFQGLVEGLERIRAVSVGLSQELEHSVNVLH